MIHALSLLIAAAPPGSISKLSAAETSGSAPTCVPEGVDFFGADYDGKLPCCGGAKECYEKRLPSDPHFLKGEPLVRCRSDCCVKEGDDFYGAGFEGKFPCCAGTIACNEERPESKKYDELVVCRASCTEPTFLSRRPPPAPASPVEKGKILNQIQDKIEEHMPWLSGIVLPSCVPEGEDFYSEGFYGKKSCCGDAKQCFEKRLPSDPHFHENDYLIRCRSDCCVKEGDDFYGAGFHGNYPCCAGTVACDEPRPESDPHKAIDPRIINCRASCSTPAFVGSAD